MERRSRHYDHSNWSPGSGRTWTYSSGDTSVQCAAFMEAINCSAIEDIKDDSLREEIQLWLQRFASLQVIGKNIERGKSPVRAVDQPPRVAQIPLEFDPPRVKRWSAEDEALRQYLIEKLAESMHIEEWMTSDSSCSLFHPIPPRSAIVDNDIERPVRYRPSEYCLQREDDEERGVRSLDRRRLSSQLSEAFHIFARSTDLPRLVTTTTNLNY